MKKATYAALAVAILGTALTGCSLAGSESIEQKGTVETAKTIEVEASNADIHIYPGKVDKIEAHLYGETYDASKYHLDLDHNGDRAIIRVEQNSKFGIGNDSPKLDITVPQAEYDKWNVTSSSGDVVISSPTVGDLAVEASSGDIELDSYKGDKLQATTNSGEVRLKDISAKEAEAVTSSGDLTVNQFAGDFLRVETSSGDVKATSITGEVKGVSSSGKVTLGMKELTRNLQVKSSSGDVTISLPSGSNFEFDTNTSSGDVSIDFPATFDSDRDKNKLGKVGTGGPKLTLDTASGDVSIERN